MTSTLQDIGDLLGRDPTATAIMLAEVMGQRPEAVDAARADAADFADLFCWGTDYESGATYKAELYPWQRVWLRDLSAGRKVREIILKTRGCGASWAAIWYASWLLWSRPPAQVLLVSETEDKAADLMRRHRFVAEHLPAGLHYPKAKDTDNLASRLLANGSEIHSLCGDPDSIRSYHPSLVILDEAAKLRSDPRPALYGLDCDILMLSTADGYANAFAQIWEDAYREGGVVEGYKPRFVSWRDRPDLAERPSGVREIIRQEYPATPEEAFRVSGAAYFDLDALAVMEHEHVRKPELEDNGRLRVWEQAVPGLTYLLECDVAEGKEGKTPGQDEERGGADWSVCSIREWSTGRQVAAWRGRVGEIAFAHVVFGLQKRWPGQVVVESNSTGFAVAQRLAELAPDSTYRDPDDRARPGFRMNGKRRVECLARLAQRVNERDLEIRDKGWYGEARVFISTQRRPEAQQGYHDDRIMATAVGEHIRSTTAPPASKGQHLPPLRSYTTSFERGAAAPRAANRLLPRGVKLR